ncbi:beta-galactosidase [Alkalibacterium putridalgicola]|uniref:Beta-galactosidase n=1 Tax=Alkalibacterium putridalgicola TaxID=426703 RepID=A0A1H7TFE2_9LACT|nr:beta-galactosidase family protein [Alkalibacterium putridalgicola]GEK89433.1 beta-galactosidase [Alkalibacterium putridalgicola]SEL83026.1 beta-galactosidase [Alkalibacterium putridalgicola]
MFEIREDFYWNEKPIKIISGSIHYFRVVPEYWEDRLKKLKAMGCNTVETYIPWNFHEPKEGQYDFDGMHDVAKFIKTAQSLNLFVIVRPSPYICAEWEFGGLPSWLLKDKNMQLRTYYEPLLNKIDHYFEKLFNELVPLQATHGGPIIMMQVENEYGSYNNDKNYLKALVDMMKKYGVDVPLVTSDGTWLDMLENGTLPEYAHPTVNFGSDAAHHFGELEHFIGKDSPLMVMEFWIGWFTAWGNKKYNRTDYKKQAEELRKVLNKGHVNFYMFHGGTNFGFMNGSNYYDQLTPDITSYDYDAPLSEWGDVTKKYKAFREVIQEVTNSELPPLPELVKKMDYGKVALKARTSLFENLDTISEGVKSPYTLSMEELDQDYGYVLYRQKAGPKRQVEDFRLLGTNDRAQIFLNGVLELTQYDKELGDKEVFELTEDEMTMNILVENMGRVNYGPRLKAQSKGITDGVFLNGAYRSGWTHYPLPLDNIDKVDYEKPYQEQAPSFSLFEHEIEETADTFIDMTGWGKGIVFMNGFNLGRFWEVGPQYKLYVPAPLLKEGLNQIVVFETEGKVKEELIFSNKPPY